MSFLHLNGWAIPIATCEPSHAGIAESRGYTVNGIYSLQRNSYSRVWRCRTGLLTSQERDALMEMLGHRGDGWRWALLGEDANGQHTASKHFYTDKRRPARSGQEVAQMVSAYAADGARVYDWNYNPVAPHAGSEGAACVDKGSTNLLSANEARPTVNGHLVDVFTGTHAADTTRYWTGSGAVNVNCLATNDGIEVNATAVVSTAYVASAHVYARSDNQQIVVKYLNGAGTELDSQSYTLPTAGQWYRLKTAGTQAVDTTARLRVLSNNGAMDFGVDGLQIETQTNGHPTAWLDPGVDVWGSGNGVRPAGILDYETFSTTARRGLTLSAWVNLQAVGSGANDHIVDLFDGTPAAVLFADSSDRFEFQIKSSDGNTLSCTSAAKAVGVYHVVGVHDPDANSASLYVDGALEQSDTTWSGGSRERFDPEKGSGDTSIGTAGVAGTANWLGTIGAVQVLPYPVPASIVSGWYDSGEDDRAQPGVFPIGAYGGFLQRGDDRVDVYAQLDASPHEPYYTGSTWETRGGRVAFTLFEAERR